MAFFRSALVAAITRASTWMSAAPPDALDRLLLQEAQQLHLERQGQFADFIQEQRAACRPSRCGPCAGRGRR